MEWNAQFLQEPSSLKSKFCEGRESCWFGWDKNITWAANWETVWNVGQRWANCLKEGCVVDLLAEKNELEIRLKGRGDKELKQEGGINQQRSFKETSQHFKP